MTMTRKHSPEGATGNLRRMSLVQKVGAIVSAVMIAMMLAGPASAASAGEVVATVNGRQLKQLHFDRVMGAIMPMSSFHGGISEDVKARNYKKAMDKMIDDELLYDEALRLGLAVDEATLEDEFNKAIGRLGGRERFDEALKQHDVSEKEFRRLLSIPGLVKSVLVIRVDEDATVSEAEVRAYYDKNKESHFRIQQRRFRHIVFKADPGELTSWEDAEKKAHEALDRIKGGEDFAKVAGEVSEGPRKDIGGDTGYIGKSTLPGELGNIGWGMKAGDVSDVVRTLYGYHILKMEGEPSDDIVSYDAARAQIEYQLTASRRQEVKARLMAELRQKADIKVYTDE